MSEAEVLGVARRIDLRRKMGLAVAALGGVVGAAAIMQAIPGDPSGPADPIETLAFAAIAVVCLAAGLATFLGSRLPEAAKTPRLRMLRAEANQARRSLALLFMPASLMFMLVGVLGATERVLGGQPIRRVEIFSTTAFVVILLAFGLILFGRGIGGWSRTVLDDELSRALRARALQFGYAVLLPGVVLLFLVGLYSRDLAIEFAPVLAALGVAAPAIRLFLLERAAGGDDET